MQTPQMRRAIQRGFTLIELMIVIAIIGILVSIALPAYRTYTVKARVTEALLAASECRTAVTEVYETASASPGAGNFGCETTNSSRYVASVTTSIDGLVTVTLSGDTAFKNAGVDSKTITLTPVSDSKGTVLTSASMPTPVFGWLCTPDPTLKPYTPSTCKGSMNS